MEPKCAFDRFRASIFALIASPKNTESLALFGFAHSWLRGLVLSSAMSTSFFQTHLFFSLRGFFFFGHCLFHVISYYIDAPEGYPIGFGGGDGAGAGAP